MTREKANERMELFQGTLDLLILRTLRWGPETGMDREVYRADFRGRISGRSRLTVSRAATPATRRMDQGELGSFNHQAARQVLHVDAFRTKAARCRSITLEAIYFSVCGNSTDRPSST